MCSGPFRKGTAAGLVWLNRGHSGSEGLMTSVPLVVFPIAPHILDGLGRRTGRVLAVRGEQQQGCDGGQRAEDPDFALHQTSPTLAREGRPQMPLVGQSTCEGWVWCDFRTTTFCATSTMEDFAGKSCQAHNVCTLLLHASYWQRTERPAYA